jgi:hypothetical protein
MKMRTPGLMTRDPHLSGRNWIRTSDSYRVKVNMTSMAEIGRVGYISGEWL